MLSLRATKYKTDGSTENSSLTFCRMMSFLHIPQAFSLKKPSGQRDSGHQSCLLQGLELLLQLSPLLDWCQLLSE